MEFMQVLTSRRSVRSYQDTRMEPSTVRELIEAAVHAPSAINLQPWQFWVLLGRSRIDDISDRAKAWVLDELSKDPSATAHARRQHLAPAEVSIFYHAPALVLVTSKSPDEQAAEDCCLAANALILAARDAGIGSCWVGAARAWFNLPQTKKDLCIPEAERIIAPIVLGYPTEWPAAQERRQPKIHWITCGHEPDLL